MMFENRTRFLPAIAPVDTPIGLNHLDSDFSGVIRSSSWMRTERKSCSTGRSLGTKAESDRSHDDLTEFADERNAR
jgi:hypothetical protein